MHENRILNALNELEQFETQTGRKITTTVSTLESMTAQIQEEIESLQENIHGFKVVFLFFPNHIDCFWDTNNIHVFHVLYLLRRYKRQEKMYNCK